MLRQITGRVAFRAVPSLVDTSFLAVATVAALLSLGPLAICAQPTSTATVLTLSQNSINSGTVVLLTATVTAASGSVTAGQVQFLNGKLTLGTAQGVAQANGSLVAKFPTWSFVPGVHTLTARFAGQGIPLPRPLQVHRQPSP